MHFVNHHRLHKNFFFFRSLISKVAAVIIPPYNETDILDLHVVTVIGVFVFNIKHFSILETVVTRSVFRMW